ncbi:MAG: TIGR01777 family oxidoreductase [Bacteroidales bacterium]|nr:TIGR01777 family oxidoreductase [Bacteroidales bacterium]
MKFLISGGSGFIGKSLTGILRKKHHHVKHITRADFNNSQSQIESLTEWADIVINLAGASISKKWTKAYKNELYESRISITQKIVEAINKNTLKPKLFISVSAVGFYNNSQVFDEEHNLPAGNFLGDLCSDWETVAMRAVKDTRVVVFRLGIVLGRRGGIVKRLRPLFKLGLGASIGSGEQPMSWVHISDVLNAIQYAVKNEELKGIYNLCTPNYLTNKEFSKAFAKGLNKPLLFKIPSFILKWMLGEGSEVILEGQRVLPTRLLEAGFNFRFIKIEESFQEIFRKLKKVKIEIKPKDSKTIESGN